MIRLTVLYNLPPDADEDAFVEWRLNEHQLSNMSVPGVVASSFHRIDSTLHGEPPRHRFMTTADWETREAFERGFHDEAVQAKLREDVKRIRDAVFLISEEMVSQKAAGSTLHH